MKITKKHHESLIFYILLSATLFSLTFCNTMSTLVSFKSTSLKAKKHHQSPSLYENWVSFFHFTNTSHSLPHSFFINTEYSKQSKIPSKTSFFAQVTPNKVNFLNTKTFTHIYDTLNIDFIKPIPENNNFLGGIKDLGKFNEGYCFQVSTVKAEKEFVMTYEEPCPSKGKNEVWLICLKDEKDKDTMMKTIIKQKIKKQTDLGITLNIGNDISEDKPSRVIDEDINEPGLGPNDGYWIMLQDWSQCTKKCGGGKQVRQLQCIPPKKGGKPCQGSSIRERPCNTQPCPEPKLLSQVIKREENPLKNLMSSNAPIVKMMPISQRPQRYDKCHIKDTDASYINEKGVRVPIRLVMNNKSISAFQDENLSSSLITFLLEDTQFKLLKENKSCFRLENVNGHADFCSLVEDCAGNRPEVSNTIIDTYHNSFVNEWNYDFNLFKTQCFQERKVNYDISNDPEFQKKQSELQQEFIQQKKNKIKSESTKSEEFQLMKKRKETEAMTLSALMKEKHLEDMLIKEEAEREEEELKEIQLQLENEKKKKDCMKKAIQEKQLESEAQLSTSEAERSIEQLKKQVQLTIQKQRNEVQEKIKRMRQINNRKRQHLLQQIQLIRTETAGHVNQATRKGDTNTCKAIVDIRDQGIKQGKINEYCSMNLVNFIPDCTTNFCYSCCENEFGDIYISERNQCYNTVCNTV